jgi:hypothetical protein
MGSTFCLRVIGRFAGAGTGAPVHDFNPVVAN